MLDLPTPPPSPQPAVSCDPEDKIGHILADWIQLTGILGVGAYGTVYKARDIKTNVEYAVKALNKLSLDPRQKTFQDREIALHYQASQHANVVSLVKILDSSECTYVVLEYCPEGDLFAKITEEGHYIGNDYKARKVFLQILDAVRYCHSQGVYHRDLKPENILVKDNGWTVKLADFGLATQDRITSDFGCGSTFYMSPECQQVNPKPFACYSSAANDIWSLGVILVNLTCSRNPWKRASMDDSTFRAYMRDRNFLQSILPISDELNYILQRIFEVNPQRRICIEELRDLIMRCPSFTSSPSVSNSPQTCAYDTIALSPVEPVVQQMDYQDVPPMDPLPVQQYPQMAGAPYPSPQPSAFAHNLPLTPPGSNTCSPHLAPFTYAPKAGYASGYQSQSGMLHPVWPRCGQFISQLSIPRSACFWNPIY
ncbi:Hypothetical protein R9X50_00488200 [Acrodontium crateriforme]|uniref:non-specific serine/threonine protein kinase n=1 Tax=Acrodontium crateriforme TaxID=150365 RepID=A0AAQ3MBS1_9PEZI|nr:Hypothetical protein R9X50_00488200 [Acrodontium crateriforme]